MRLALAFQIILVRAWEFCPAVFCALLELNTWLPVEWICDCLTIVLQIGHIRPRSESNVCVGTL